MDTKQYDAMGNPIPEPPTPRGEPVVVRLKAELRAAQGRADRAEAEAERHERNAIGRLEALSSVAALKFAISEAFDMAGGRWSEWGDRAESVAEILEAVDDAPDPGAPLRAVVDAARENHGRDSEHGSAPGCTICESLDALSHPQQGNSEGEAERSGDEAGADAPGGE